MGTEIDRLEIQIEAKASKANRQLDELITKLGKVSGSLTGINTGCILGIGVSANSSNNNLKSFTKTLVGFSSTAIRAAYSSKSLASTLKNMGSNAIRVARNLRGVGKAAEASMDYIETYNYYNVTMSKIASEFSRQWQKYGYESGESYAKSFSGRLNELTQKMSGYSVGEDGMLSMTGGKNLSLDPEQLMNYQSNVAAITNSVGLVGETSVNTAKALSMLAADMSSLKNIDMSTVMTNFQSGLIGQSRALYKYGIDITNATLQTYAYKYGLQTAVSEMTQADKMQLRLLAILDQSKVAWGDQANTLNSVANQYRILKQQLANIARVVGNLLIPALQAVLPVINGILIAFQKLVNFVGNAIFGDKWKNIMDGISGGYGGADDAIGDLMDDTDNVVDGTDGIGDSIDNATDKAKKLQRTLMGFDEINKLNDNSDIASSTSDGNIGGVSGGGVGGIDLSSAIVDALADYEAIWNKALENSQNKAQEYADKIAATFNKMWRMIKSGDFEGLGEYIAGGVDYVFQKINSVFNWEKLGPGITKFVDGYTRTINSLVDNIDWHGIGKTMGDGLNVITYTLYRYLTGIDWVNIGSAIATGLNGMIDNIDWDILGRTIGAWIMKIPKIVYGFVTTLDWSAVGTGIGRALNGVFKEFDGKMIAEGINNLINGILSAIKAFIKEVDWSEVVKAIGDVLGNLDWGALAKVGLAIGVAKLIAGLGKLLKIAISETLVKMLGGGIENAIKGLGKKIAGAIGGMSFTDVISTLGTKLSGVAGKFSLLGTDISAAFSSGGIFSAIQTGFSGLIGMIGPWGLVIGAAIAGIIAVICNWDKVKEFFTQTLPSWWNETVVPWIQGLPESFNELPGMIWEKIIEVKDRFIDWASQLYETVSEGISKVIDKIVEFFAGLPEKIGYAIGFVIGKLSSWVVSINEWVNENFPAMIDGIVTFFEGLPGKIADAVAAVKDKLAEWAESIWKYLSTKIPEIIDNVVNFFDDLPNKLKEIGKNIVKGFIDGIKSMWQTAKEEVGDFVDGVIKGFTDGFDVHSPSRITYGIGVNVVEGLANALSDKWSVVNNNLSHLLDGTTSTISDSLDNVGRMGRTTTESLKSIFSGLHIPLPHLQITWSNMTIGTSSFSIPSFGISWYAKGGFPDSGELFMAREHGPEMIGRMGNKNAVVNNDQIIDGIAAGVGPAVYNAVVAAMDNFDGNQLPEVNIYVGGKKVTDVVIEEVNKRTKSTGRCPIII